MAFRLDQEDAKKVNEPSYHPREDTQPCELRIFVLCIVSQAMSHEVFVLSDGRWNPIPTALFDFIREVRAYVNELSTKFIAIQSHHDPPQ